MSSFTQYEKNFFSDLTRLKNENKLESHLWFLTDFQLYLAYDRLFFLWLCDLVRNKTEYLPILKIGIKKVLKNHISFYGHSPNKKISGRPRPSLIFLRPFLPQEITDLVDIPTNKDASPLIWPELSSSYDPRETKPVDYPEPWPGETPGSDNEDE